MAIAWNTDEQLQTWNAHAFLSGERAHLRDWLAIKKRNGEATNTGREHDEQCKDTSCRLRQVPEGQWQTYLSVVETFLGDPSVSKKTILITVGTTTVLQESLSFLRGLKNDEPYTDAQLDKLIADVDRVLTIPREN